MKRIVYVLALLGIIFTGCDPLEDINNDIDSADNPVVAEVEYTLTADDYAELGLTFGNFSSDEDARTMLPAFLADKYPYFGEGSSAVVTYDLYVGSADGVSDFTGADIYEFTNSDYASAGSDAFGFYPNADASDAIPSVLDAQVSDPQEGQIVLAKYDQYTEQPEVGLADLVSYDFAGSFEGWTVAEEFGTDDVWTSQSGYVQGNSYFGGQVANTEWLVSPSIDLSGESDLKFQITQELDYAGDASLLKIYVSTNYAGDVLTATWDEITLANPATGDMAPSEDYDFSAYDGQTINVAFRYESSDSDAARWRIASLKIKTLGATGETASKGEYFMYSGGSWELVDGVYYLSSADFDSMGEGSGEPGQYNNFSSSISPNNYLPAFMEITFPYGQEDEELFIIYDYYSSSSGAQIRGNLYTFTDGMWVGHESVIETSLQFGFENGVWVPDNTIRYALTGADYSAIVSALAADYPTATASMDNYGNMDRRPGNAAEWTDEMVLEALNVVLDNIDPSAAEEQKYIVTVDVYTGSNGTEDFAVIKMGGEWVYQE